MADYVNDATLDGPDTRDGVGTATPASGRSELSSLPEIAAGANIGGRYEVIRRLGEGGMGAVYEAEHTAIQRRVALKVLHAEFGRNPSVVERFLQEARAVNAVRHRNVVEGAQCRSSIHRRMGRSCPRRSSTRRTTNQRSSGRSSAKRLPVGPTILLVGDSGLSHSAAAATQVVPSSSSGATPQWFMRTFSTTSRSAFSSR